jgi:uncharacterized protein YjbI with pentapeptide repeats
MRCTWSGCRGAAVSDGLCVPHMEPITRDRVLGGWRSGGSLDLRGIRIDDDFLQQILAGAPSNAVGGMTLRDVAFDEANFTVRLNFDDATLDTVTFRAAQFDQAASFSDCRFASPPSFEDAQFLRTAVFDHATFPGETLFSRCRFGGRATFEECQFGSRAWFAWTRFDATASFERATFADSAFFNQAQFQGGVSFDDVTLGEGADFSQASMGNDVWFQRMRAGDNLGFTGAVFGDRCYFDDAAIGDGALFVGCQFGRRCRFSGTSFGREARMDQSQFGSDFSLAGASFDGRVLFTKSTFGENAAIVATNFRGGASFEEAHFGPKVLFGPVLSTSPISFREAALQRPRRFAVSAPVIRASRMSLPDGGRLQARWAEIDLSDCQFPKATTISPLDAPATEEEHWGIYVLAPENANIDDLSRPRLVSLVSSDVANLVLTDVDLSACHFAHASNLDRLKIENGRFARVSRLIGLRFPRRAIAEEHEWRAARAGFLSALWGRGWHPAATRRRWPLTTGDTPELGPPLLEGIYRSLRKGREDANDEPGAADFYYGEMEMRRLGARSFSMEGAILRLYQILAGYGLRVIVPLALISVLLTGAAAYLFQQGYFKPPSSYWAALVQTTEAAMSILRGNDPAGLRLRGQAVIVLLRVVIPILVALAILAIRGRVKRR